LAIAQVTWVLAVDGLIADQLASLKPSTHRRIDISQTMEIRGLNACPRIGFRVERPGDEHRVVLPDPTCLCVYVDEFTLPCFETTPLDVGIRSGSRDDTLGQPHDRITLRGINKLGIPQATG
jgi:hypothetical protein